uniref:Tc1-like transposase DDE domain-containing protein n=1 Tax=Neolamprologus brichardi TaxID=32507 RepID=A0A3Q4HU58_NEOBR
MRGNWIGFQQDNDPKHTSKLVLQWIKQANIKLLERHVRNLWTMLESWPELCQMLGSGYKKHLIKP